MPWVASWPSSFSTRSLHFASGLIGKGDCQDPVWGDTLLRDEISDALGQHPRLSGTRPGKDQDRPCASRDGFSLLRVKMLEEIHD